jgi:hypothetical protein
VKKQAKAVGMFDQAVIRVFETFREEEIAVIEHLRQHMLGRVYEVGAETINGIREHTGDREKHGVNARPSMSRNFEF